MTHTALFRCLIGVASLLLTAPAPAAPPTAFTYQGELKQSGTPFTGSVPITFRLFAAPAGGAALGTITLPSVSVADGLVTTSLDFGVSPFTQPDQRWLEVEVSGQIMSPRTLLTPAPFSLTTRGISVDVAGNVGIGQPAVATARLAVSGGLSVFGASGQSIALFSDSIHLGSAGTEDIAYSYEALTDTHTFSTAGTTRMVVDSQGRVGIGTTTPSALLDLASGPAHVVVNTQGRVGIGTTTPSALLDISGPAGNDTIKLPASSISAAECLDEPGVAWTIAPDNILTTVPYLGPLDLISQGIDCPADGYILATGSAFLNVATGSVLVLNLRLDNEIIPSAATGFATDAGSASVRRGTSPAFRVLPVTQGHHNVTLQVGGGNQGGSDLAGRGRLALLFIPTAYGAVSPSP